MEPARSVLQPDIEHRIGRNLLRYQLVEQRLKMLLPMHQVTLSSDGIEALKAKVAKLRLATLGQLLASYSEGAATTAASDAREQQLAAFLDARNWLVHHLLTDHQMLSVRLASSASTATIRLHRYWPRKSFRSVG